VPALLRSGGDEESGTRDLSPGRRSPGAQRSEHPGPSSSGSNPVVPAFDAVRARRVSSAPGGERGRQRFPASSGERRSREPVRAVETRRDLKDGRGSLANGVSEEASSGGSNPVVPVFSSRTK
jgi:hypothetical protein